MSDEQKEHSRKVLILGSGGFLGRYFERYPNTLGIARSAKTSGYAFELSSNEDFKVLKNIIERVKPTIIINCMAVTSINQCERDPVHAKLVNAALPGFIARLTYTMNISYVHFSTDAVFDGKNSPYSEEDSPSPISIYGITKLQGENNVLTNNPGALVLRTNFFGFSFQKSSLFNFFYWNLQSSRNCEGYSEVIFSPMYVKDVCGATFALLENSQRGIFHVVGGESLSKLEFGRKIASTLNLPESTIVDTKRPTSRDNQVRSFDLRLDNKKMKMIFQPQYSIADGIIDSLSEANKETTRDVEN